MRLLLDEHLDRDVAVRLRSRGHDVEAVTEREKLLGATDGSLLDVCVAEHRVLVTRDYSTVRPLLKERLELGGSTWGVIFVSPAIPERREASTAVVDALEDLLAAHAKDDGLKDREVWLRAVTRPARPGAIATRG